MEKQLLFLLDYDLRFDEAEACAFFAPFMVQSAPVPAPPPMPTSTSTRTAAAAARQERQKAVSKVAQAGKARAQQQMPPTPPHEKASSNAAPPSAQPPSQPQSQPHTSVAEGLSGKVHNLARRLSSTYLGTNACEKPAQSLPPTLSAMSSCASSSASSSTSSSTSGSGTESEPEAETGIETDDDDTERSRLLDGVGEQREPDATQRFVLRPLPPSIARRRSNARKTSDATITDVRAALGAAASETALAEHAGTGSPLVPTAAKRRSLSKRTSVARMQGRLVPSRTLPNLAAGVGTGAGGFLSRMWGAATKASAMSSAAPSATAGAALAAPAGGTGKTPLVDIVEPEAAHTAQTQAQALHATGAFHLRRLAHSRSAMFRSTAAGQPGYGGEGEP